MLEAFFGLHRPAFPPIADPKSLFAATAQQSAHIALQTLAVQRVGVVLLEAAEGLGKTELLRLYQRTVDPERVSTLLFAQPNFDMTVLCKAIGELHVGPFRAPPELALVSEILSERQQKGHHTVLLIDNAERLTDTAWRALDKLATLAAGTETTITMVLSGRPPFASALAAGTLAALRAQAKARVNLQKLSRSEATEFVLEGLRRAGVSTPERVLSPEAVWAIVDAADGIPGRLATLTNAVLQFGAKRRQKPVPGITAEWAIRRLTGRLAEARQGILRKVGWTVAAVCLIAVAVSMLRPHRPEAPDPLAPRPTPPAVAAVQPTVERAPVSPAAAAPSPSQPPPPAENPATRPPDDVFLLPAREGDTLQRLYRLAYRDQRARPSFEQFLAANPHLAPEARLTADELISFPGPLGSTWR